MGKERPSNLQPYFDLFKGQPHTMSEMSDVVRPAVEILVCEGKAIEQLGLDGDSLIYMPEAVKKNSSQDPSSQKSH